MDITESILETLRSGIGLSKDTVDFDSELIMHLNSAIGTLNQNGVGNFVVVTDSTTTWSELKDPLQVEGNKYFQMVPLFIALSTKIIFDPPPPSTVDYYSKNIDQLLWRLKIAYDNTAVTTTTEH